MSLLPDPAVLLRSASRLESHADEVRTQANQLAAATQSTVWTSIAATAFRDQSGSLSLGLRSCADRLDDAAAELRKHAATVRGRIEAVEAVATAAVTVEHAAEHVVAGGVKGALHMVGFG